MTANDPTPPPTTTRDLIAARVIADPAWLLVLRQYDHGLRGYPDPFRNRRPTP